MKLQQSNRRMVLLCVLMASLIAGFFLVYGSQKLWGQKDTDTEPLTIQSSISRTNGGPEIAYTLVNKSAKEIVAFTLLTTFVGSDNKPIGRLTTNQVLGLDARSTRASLRPNENWTPKKGLGVTTDQNGTPAQYKMAVDYILFKDGSTWGADQAKQSLQIAGIQQGWAMARTSLKSVLVKEGPAAVLEIVGQDVPHNHK